MALLWVEGFETFGTTPGARPSPLYVVSRKYFTYNFEVFDDIVVGRNGLGYYLNSTSSFLRTRNLTTDRTLITGAAIKITLSESTSTIFYFYQNTGQGMRVSYTGDGELAVYNRADLKSKTVGLGLAPGTWYHIQFKVYCDQTVGTYELKVNGVTVLSDTGVDTQYDTDYDHHSAAQVGPGAANIKVDDWYICDGSGSSNNDFLGDMAVETIYPTSDSSVTWTPDTGGTNYTQVNEVVVDDADYVEATTGKDLYGYGSLVTSNLIKGLMVSTDAELTSATAFSLKNVVSSSSTESTVQHDAIGVGASSLSSIFETDPNTAAAWLYGNVNSALFGVEVA
jgi:hypothetical protein